MLDVGANVDCKPQNLQQFAIMGDIYFRIHLQRTLPTASNPRVGLLSVGEEETKGNDLTREAFQLIKALPLNFLGNVEGRDLYNGRRRRHRLRRLCGQRGAQGQRGPGARRSAPF